MNSWQKFWEAIGKYAGMNGPGSQPEDNLKLKVNKIAPRRTASSRPRVKTKNLKWVVSYQESNPERIPVSLSDYHPAYE